MLILSLCKSWPLRSEWRRRVLRVNKIGGEFPFAFDVNFSSEGHAVSNAFHHLGCLLSYLGAEKISAKLNINQGFLRKPEKSPWWDRRPTTFSLPVRMSQRTKTNKINRKLHLFQIFHYDFCLTCILSNTPVLSILLATFTEFPQISYWGLWAPITPAITGPWFIPGNEAQQGMS